MKQDREVRPVELDDVFKLFTQHGTSGLDPKNPKGRSRLALRSGSNEDEELSRGALRSSRKRGGIRRTGLLIDEPI